MSANWSPHFRKDINLLEKSLKNGNRYGAKSNSLLQKRLNQYLKHNRGYALCNACRDITGLNRW